MTSLIQPPKIEAGLLGAAGAPARIRRPGGLNRRRQLMGLAMAAPAIILLGVFFVWPLIRTIGMSFYDWPLLGKPSFSGVDNYVEAFSDEAFGKAVGFTLLYTVIITPILLIVGLVLVSIVIRGTRAARFFQTIYFLPVVIGLASGSYLFLFMFQPGIGPATNLLGQLGVLDPSKNLFADGTTGLILVITMVTWKVSGLQMLLLLAGIQSIPAEVLEASRIDGANRWQTFTQIILPLLRPTLALVLVFSVAGSLLAFDQFYIMTTGGPANSTITAVFEIYRTSFIKFDLGYGAALSILLMLMLGVVSAVQLLLLRNSDNS